MLPDCLFKIQEKVPALQKESLRVFHFKSWQALLQVDSIGTQSPEHLQIDHQEEGTISLIPLEAGSQKQCRDRVASSAHLSFKGKFEEASRRDPKSKMN